MADKPIKITYKQADQLVFRNERGDVHTFLGGIGARWPRRIIMAEIRKYGAEIAGDSAIAMGHGVVVLREGGALFVETSTEKLEAFLRKAD